MAFTFIQAAIASNAASGYQLDTPGGDDLFTFQDGDALIVVCSWEDADRTATVADTADNNAFTMSNVVNSNNDSYLQMGYVLSATAATSIAIRQTLNDNAAYRGISVWQFRPDSGETVTLDVQNKGGTGNSSSMSTATFSTTGDDVAIVCGVKSYTSQTWSNAQIGGVDKDGAKVASLHYGWRRIVAATLSNVTGNVTGTASTRWSCDVIALKAAAAAAGLSIPVAMHHYLNH